ncbi:hypothetical protein [Micromonospora deserti]|uniref:SRPBCC family protein n=1 Tax=Micromonospora deserti TaxID=2070366 RepID=A0A2W2CM18_9ACTN|nr:hypothetical protein [Micromonospora deserti]PZF99000.1 hypothetical protein C1I99_12375 [Micromonospora deserti]
MLEAGNRMRGQPPPPAVVFEALATPDRDPTRPWLRLLDDEQAPRILRAERPHLVVWSSLWPRRPDAQVQFHLASDSGGGTQLRWRLLVAGPLPDPSLLGHLRKRLNVLINENLRATFGQ